MFNLHQVVDKYSYGRDQTEVSHSRGRTHEISESEAEEISEGGDSDGGAGICHDHGYPFLDRDPRIEFSPGADHQEVVVHPDGEDEERHGRGDGVEGNTDVEEEAKGDDEGHDDGPHPKVHLHRLRSEQRLEEEGRRTW